MTIFDYYWLYSVCNTPFHPSDPSDYYNEIVGLQFGEVLNIESSNTFYFLVNWFYWKVWNNPFIASFFLKINNVLIYVCAFLLLTKKIKNVSSIDYILLFNPYTIMTLVRNVRDMYIILFTIMIMLGIGIIKDNKLNIFWTIIAAFLLFITRSILFLPLILVIWELKKNYLSIYWKYAVYGGGIILFVFYFNTIIHVAGNQMISSMIANGEEADLYLPLLENGLSVSLLKNIIPRLCIGFISFIFTPHPVNFISNWIVEMDQNGMSNIYTGTDNALIAMGSIFNYLFVFPLVILFILNYKKSNKYIFIFVICYIILYVISYLGISDIRNRNTAIFFILAGIMFSDEKLQLKKKHYFITSFFFCCIMFFSSI